ncbi:MAG: Fur family transcriptional regulator [Alphaproteobacteria bacterium]
MAKRPYTHSLERLRAAGLRPTRQRLALVRLLFDKGDRHVTAEQLHAEAQANGVSISLATIYNSLHQFTAAGLLREVVVDSVRRYFDTNISGHHHFFLEDEGTLQDIPGDRIALAGLPETPSGTEIDRIDVIVRLRAARQG